MKVYILMHTFGFFLEHRIADLILTALLEFFLRKKLNNWSFRVKRGLGL